MSIDLHTHSRASDGTQAPAQVLVSAAAAGLSVLALTDHDTTAGWAEAADAVDRTGVALVRGTEISTRHHGMSVHLLSYLHDPADRGLAAMFERSRSSRELRAQRIVELLACDMPLTWDDVVAQVSGDATIGRPHIADALVRRGHVADRSEAFERMLSQGAPYYVDHWSPTTVDAIPAVLAAGGVPVIAHPRAVIRGRTLTDRHLAELTENGLAGLEVDHRDHADADREHLRALAARLALLVTGSSDYHGTGKLNLLGENTTDPRVLAEIESRGRLPVLWPS